MRSIPKRAATAAIVLVGLGIALVAVSKGQALPAAKPELVAWEYRSVPHQGGGYMADQSMDGLGQEGWELVSVTSQTEPQRLLYVFKRLKRDKQR